MPLRTDKDILALMREGTQIDAALRRAVRQALKAHVDAGLPVVEWRDGKTVLVQPEEIERRLKAMDEKK